MRESLLLCREPHCFLTGWYGSLPADAPSARHFVMCPTVVMPPSAMTGTPKWRAYSATLYTAVPWGRPTAMTVKQTTISMLLTLHQWCSWLLNFKTKSCTCLYNTYNIVNIYIATILQLYLSPTLEISFFFLEVQSCISFSSLCDFS